VKSVEDWKIGTCHGYDKLVNMYTKEDVVSINCHGDFPYTLLKSNCFTPFMLKEIHQEITVVDICR